MPARRRKPKAEAAPAVESTSSTPAEGEASPTATACVDDIIAELGASAVTLSDSGLSIHIPGVISSGSEMLDWALGRGGWPLGRMVLVGGEEGAGKTTLALAAVANCQLMGGVAVYLDAEHKLDLSYAVALGVDVGRLIMPPKRDLDDPMTVEESMDFVSDIADKYLSSRHSRKVPFLVVYDSITALMTDQEADGVEAPGSQARAMSSTLRKLNERISDSAMCMMMLSQLRERIGITFGSKYTTTGGKAPRFYSAVIAHCEPRAAIKVGGKKESGDGETRGRGKRKEGRVVGAMRIGHHTAVDIVKNQVGPPFRPCDVAIVYGKGIDYIDSVAGLAKAAGLIEIKGSWSRYTGPGAALPGEDGEIRWQGAEGLRTLLTEKPEEFARLVSLIHATYPRIEGIQP